MNFRTVFAVHQPVTSSTKCILQFWQRFSRTLEKSGGTSLHGCMNFCANRGLICKMYGESSKNRFCTSFQNDLQMLCASVHALPDGFRRLSADYVLWKVHLTVYWDVQYFREKIWITEILIWKSALYWKTLTRADYSRIFWVFMRACMRSGNLKQISCLLKLYSKLNE